MTSINQQHHHPHIRSSSTIVQPDERLQHFAIDVDNRTKRQFLDQTRTKLDWTSMKMMIVMMLVFTLIDCIRAQQNPTISYINPDKMVNIGDTVDLQCSVQYQYGFPVIWAKIDSANPSNNLFISKGSSLSIPDNRYSIRHDSASSTFTLQLSKIQEIDAGVYQCQILLSATSRVTANTQLTVNISPTIADNSTRSIITSVGSAVQLQCWAQGQPKPSVSWRRQNNDLLPTGGTVYKGNVLFLHNVSVADRGTYYCIANNGVGRGAKRNVVLEVEFAPLVSAGKGAQQEDPTALPRYFQAVNHPVELECTIESYPLPSTIEWTLNGHRLQDDANMLISMQGDSHAVVNTRLRIHSVEPKHYGVYACAAVNKLGFSQSEVRLLESEVPVCPPACGSLYSSAGQTKNSFWIVCTLMMMIMRWTINKVNRF